MTQFKAFKTKEEAAAYKKKHGGTIWSKAHGFNSPYGYLTFCGYIDEKVDRYVVTKEA